MSLLPYFYLEAWQKPLHEEWWSKPKLSYTKIIMSELDGKVYVEHKLSSIKGGRCPGARLGVVVRRFSPCHGMVCACLLGCCITKFGIALT